MRTSGSLGDERGRRLTFNQRCLVALCTAMLVVALTYLVIGTLLVVNRAAADSEIARLIAELDAPISAGLVEGAVQLVFGLCDLVVFGLGLWGALRPRRLRPFLVFMALGFMLQAAWCLWGSVDALSSVSGIRSVVAFATFFGFAFAVRREWRGRLQSE